MPMHIPAATLRIVMRSRAEDAGGLVERLRHEKGYGPTQFSALIGVPLQTLHKIEKGHIVPRDQLKAAIALALEVELEDLYPWPTRDEIIRSARQLKKATEAMKGAA